MSSFRLLAVAMCVLAACVGRADAALPAEAYGRLPALLDAAVSPDGSKLIVALSDDTDEQSYRIIDIERGAPLFGSSLGKPSNTAKEFPVLRRVAWLTDRYASFVADTGRVETVRTAIVDVLKQSHYYLGTKQGYTSDLELSALMAPTPADSTARMLQLSSNPFEPKLSLYKITLENGATLELASAANAVNYEVDAGGGALARVDTVYGSNHWKLFDVRGRYDRLVLEGDSEAGLALPATHK